MFSRDVQCILKFKVFILLMYRTHFNSLFFIVDRHLRYDQGTETDQCG